MENSNPYQDIIKNIENRKAFKTVNKVKSNLRLGKFVKILFFVVFLIMFLPWTQNIQSNGFVSILHPDDRPQKIQSIIAGKIEKWFVKEGDFVKKNDTILIISEVKSEYLDPELLTRTEEQLGNKADAVLAYDDKIEALKKQEKSLQDLSALKIKQANNYLKQYKWKARADSNEVVACQAQYDIALKQLVRTEELYEKGIKSLTDLEHKRIKMQEMTAKLTSLENKWFSSKNDVLNAVMEINNVKNEYNEKLAKVRSEQYTALSDKLDASAIASKLKNQYSNYEIRQGQYIIKASRDGYVTKLTKSGTGENLKEGEEVAWLMPREYQLAVEFYVDPQDYPLIKVGEKVRLQFDGWPALVFTGWPGISTGTYSGDVYAIDQNINENGKYRILVKQDKDDNPWPKDIRFGGGAKSFVLLNDVPIWYELWRNLNGFPPDYYKSSLPIKKSKK